MSDYNQQPGYGQQGHNPNPQYNANQPYPQQPPVQQQYPGAPQWPHMRLGEWIVAQLLMIIPIVNIVLMFMWAFGSNVNPSKKTYFQSALLFAAVGAVFGILIAIAMGGMLFALIDSAW